MPILPMCSALVRGCLCLLLAAAWPAVHAQDRHLDFADTLPESVGRKTVAIERVIGTGTTAARGQFVVIHYEGWVYDPAAPDHKGLKFDSTFDRGHALSVLIGVNRMLTGLDRGILGMKVGGRRTLVVPPHLGYGDRLAYKTVPPNSTLIFEVDLLDVVRQQNAD